MRCICFFFLGIMQFTVDVFLLTKWVSLCGKQTYFKSVLDICYWISLSISTKADSGHYLMFISRVSKCYSDSLKLYFSSLLLNKTHLNIYVFFLLFLLFSLLVARLLNFDCLRLYLKNICSLCTVQQLETLSDDFLFCL